ncbi:MAG TPA: NDP-sugar synthase [Thermoplasmata archaeon]|nr:NDP-sugar synthase [Thermoplasmata archaeon]
MQAVLIAGGLGTRLRPLTFSRPKALLPLVNRPLVLHVLDRLSAAVDEVLIAANYRTEQLRDFFRTVDVGKRVEVVREKRPLGTGGCLKNLEARLSGTFLAFNADIVSSLAVDALIAAHRRNGGVGTVALWEVEDPTAFGVVAMDGDRITKFVEKPTKGEAPSNLVNAGAYVLEPEVLAGIPAGTPASLERDVFPKILRKGLFGHRFPGYWSDVGTLENYLRATEILLREHGSEVSVRAHFAPTATPVKPLAVAAGTSVGGRVGPVVSIGTDGQIGRARLERCVLFDRVTVADDASISGSILGDGCRIGARAVVRDSILGEGASVAADEEIVGKRVRA